jgi:hypothetical protein
MMMFFQVDVLRRSDDAPVVPTTSTSSFLKSSLTPPARAVFLSLNQSINQTQKTE